MREWKIEWFDSNGRRRNPGTPLYFGRLNPGETRTVVFRIKNGDFRAENIRVHVTPAWVRAVRAPEALGPGNSGTVEFRVSPPKTLGEVCQVCRHKVQKLGEPCECGCDPDIHDDGPPMITVMSIADVVRVSK